MPTREEVDDVVNGELAYINYQGFGPKTGSTAEFLLFIEHHVSYARRCLVNHGAYGAEQALDSMRKIAALSIACMEKNGANARLPHQRLDGTLIDHSAPRPE